MKTLEIELPEPDDSSVIARVKRLHFYSVREEFVIVWKSHEQFLLDYEERVKKTMQLHAKIGTLQSNFDFKLVHKVFKFIFFIFCLKLMPISRRKKPKHC